MSWDHADLIAELDRLEDELLVQREELTRLLAKVKRNEAEVADLRTRLAAASGLGSLATRLAKETE